MTWVRTSKQQYLHDLRLLRRRVKDYIESRADELIEYVYDYRNVARQDLKKYGNEWGFSFREQAYINYLKGSGLHGEDLCIVDKYIEIRDLIPKLKQQG